MEYERNLQQRLTWHRSPRGKYSTTSDMQRVELVRLIVEEKTKLVDAAKILGMKYSTAMSIIDLFKQTGRVAKQHNGDGIKATNKKICNTITEIVETDI